VHAGDQGESKCNGDAVEYDVRCDPEHLLKRYLDQSREYRLTDPAETEARHGDAKLSSCDISVLVIQGYLHQACPVIPLLDQLSDTSAA